MMRAAIYARKSTEQRGVADQAKSVPGQVEDARAFCAERDWAVMEDAIFTDDAVSGTEFERRPGLVRLMAAATSTPRPFDILVMADGSRLGREVVETAFCLKQLVSAGVRVFNTLTKDEVRLDTALDKVMITMQSFASEVERERTSQRTFAALKRRCEAGQVTGGKLFGYRNVEMTDGVGPDGRPRRVGVIRQVIPEEAAVVTRIFALYAEGAGMRAIAHRLNAEGAKSPRARQGRLGGWAPSSVGAVLTNPTYTGRVVWNKSRKRDRFGRVNQTDRPRTEWVETVNEDLRIVSDAAWQAAHAALHERRDLYQKWLRREPGGRPSGRGQSGRYLCSGLAQCPVCGGSMTGVKWVDSTRPPRYVCSTKWLKGRAACPNDAILPMAAADAAVRDLLRQHVLSATIVEAALDLAVAMLKDASDPMAGHRAALEERLKATERQLANLTETLADLGGSPTVIAAIKTREAERQRLLDDLAPLTTLTDRTATWTDATLRRALRAKLDDWRGLVDGHVAEARTILDAALADRMTFTKGVDVEGSEVWTLTAPLAWDKVLMRLAPDTFSGLQRLAGTRGGSSRRQVG